MKTVRQIALVGLAGTSLLLAGCMGHGQHTTEGLSLAKQRMGQLKSGTEFEMAEQQFLAGNLEKAKKTVMKAITLNEKSPKGFVLLGRIYLEEGKLEDARGALAKAAELDAKNVDAQYYQGIVFERFSQFDEAQACYTRAAELAPDNPQYVVAAGEMLVRQGKPAEAEQFLLARQEQFGHNAALRQSLGRLAMLREDYGKAVEYFSEAHRLAPDDLLMLEELMRARVAAGEYRDAEFDLSVLLKNEQYKSRRDLALLRAQCLMQISRPGEARAILTNLTSGDEGARDLPAWMLLGRACTELNDLPRMRICAGRLIALAPERHEGYLLRALHQKQSGDLAGALRSIDQAVDTSGTNYEPALLKSMWLAEAGRQEEALATAQQVLQADPGNARAQQIVQGISGGAMTTAPEAGGR